MVGCVLSRLKPSESAAFFTAKNSAPRALS